MNSGVGKETSDAGRTGHAPAARPAAPAMRGARYFRCARYASSSASFARLISPSAAFHDGR